MLTVILSTFHDSYLRLIAKFMFNISHVMNIKLDVAIFNESRQIMHQSKMSCSAHTLQHSADLISSPDGQSPE